MLEEFRTLMGATALGRDNVEDAKADGLVRGYLDVAVGPRPSSKRIARKLRRRAKPTRSRSSVWAMRLAWHAAAQDQTGFHNWLKSKKLLPLDVDPRR